MYIDETLYSGRPADVSGRLPKEVRCYDALDALGIEYFRADHEHADTIEACEGVEKVLGCRICKNLFLANRQQTEFYLLLMPGEKPFKTKVLSKQINSARLSFGTPEFMEELLDITPGSVSVLGLLNDKNGRVKLLVDRDLLRDEFLGCHPCINTSSLKIRTADIVEKFLPSVKHEPEYVELPWVIEE
jgi:Ala-tRNA(Pro) deacylase